MGGRGALVARSTGLAAIGAYLLCLWGLPDGVAEAVAHHHDPLAAPGAALDAVAAVHIAEALAHEVQQHAEDRTPPSPLDLVYLDQLGVRSELDHWRVLARSADDAATAA